MPEIHLKQYKKTGDSRYIYQNESDKACSQHGMAYRDFKFLNRGAAADNVLSDKTFNITKNSKYDGYQRRFVSMVSNFFDKNTSGGAATLANKSAIKN